VQQRFGNTNIAAGTRPRPEFRGSGGQQVLRPGGGAANRPSAGTLPSNRPVAGGRPSSGANRPSAGTLPSNRPVAGGRPSSGANRPSAGTLPSNRPLAGNRPSSGAKRPSAGNRPSSGANRPTARSRPAPQRIASRPSGGGVTIGLEADRCAARAQPLATQTVEWLGERRQLPLEKGGIGEA
jgi:hypothetical protein